MRRLFGLIWMTLPLAGCVTDRDLPFREVHYQASESAQAAGVVTPEVARECLEKIGSKLPQVKIVGGFFLAPALASKVPVQPTILPSHENDDIVVVAAPSMSNSLFGERKTVAGCSYHLRDKRLVFNDAHIFGGRIDVVRAKPQGT